MDEPLRKMKLDLVGNERLGATLMFRIKICGITTPEDGTQAAAAGADAIGLNFYPPSSRFVSPALAAKIARAVPENVAKVGVFVNATTEEILSIAQDVSLDFVQLHGDEAPEQLCELQECRVIKAFRHGERSLKQMAAYLDNCHRLAAVPAAVLIDASSPGTYGGTGQVVDWGKLGMMHALLVNVKVLLAGGLSPSNVAEALQTVRPFGVDVASGVETRPGCKSRELMDAFIQQVRSVGWPP